MIVQDALNVPALTVYDDAACPICNGEMHNLMLRDVARQVRFVDASAPGFERPDGMGPAAQARPRGAGTCPVPQRSATGDES